MDVFGQKDFWKVYFVLEEDRRIFFDCQNGANYHTIFLRLPEDYSLILHLDEELGIIWLEFVHSSFSKPVQIGIYDGFCMTGVFRWEELDLISSYVASQFPKYPAAPFLLLSLFTPITPDDDRYWIRKKFTESLQALGIYSEDFLQQIIPKPRREGRWVKNERTGWVLNNSLRTPNSIIENAPSPFEHFQKMLEYLEQQSSKNNGQYTKENTKPTLLEKIDHFIPNEIHMQKLLQEKFTEVDVETLLKNEPFYMKFYSKPYFVKWKEQHYLVIGQDVDLNDLITVNLKTKEMYYLVNDGSKKYLNGNVDHFLEYVKGYITLESASCDDFRILFDQELDRLTLLDPKAMEASPCNFWSKVLVRDMFDFPF